MYADAQNLRCKSIPTNKPYLLDSLQVEPGSIQLSEPHVWIDSTRIIQVTSKEKSTVQVCYRVLSPFITQVYRNRKLSDYDDSRDSQQKLVSQSTKIEQEELFDFGGVQKYGAITRGVSFGNRQNLFVNSSLNLQMNGKLDENLNIAAVITDQNVPYQPEGNTQQIRDFDNVFIKLYNDRLNVTAGDVVLTQPDSMGYFLKYYKNVQGLQVGYKGGAGRWKHESRLSGAVSKGKFHSATILPVDGLSGPYKLRGPNGERFIIVLANSEKVFVDGKLLERGFDRDYVIDYNLGEISFNNHIVITQFTIIRVDFEYAEQFYSRSNIAAYQSISRDNATLYANVYRERDNPNNRLGFKLNDTDLRQLQSIGDQSDQAFVTGLDSVQFSENRVLYAKKDTIDADGISQTIFQQTTDAKLELFAPTFSDVGIGNGDYVLKQTTANGRVYEWVSPVGGRSQGSYKPGAFIPLPNSRQMITVGGKVSFSNYEQIKTEVAFSQTDQNLYSTIQDNDNAGRAYFMSLTSTGRPSFIKNYEWEGEASAEIDEVNFTFIDRYRSILFDRDWNYVPDKSDNFQDVMFFLKGGLKKNEANKLELSLNRRKRSSLIDGWQKRVDLNQQIANINLLSSHFLLKNRQQGNETLWTRSKSDISYRKWKVVPGYQFEMDENEVTKGDSVISSQMHYKSHEMYLTNADSAKASYRVSYQLRKDKLPVEGVFKDYLYSKNVNANYRITSEKGSVSADVNYRKAEDQLGLNRGQDEVINGRVNWIRTFLHKHLKSNFSFSTGNSRELRREFVYLPVSIGEGTHTWRDLNGDGVQDLNEFFEAINPDERIYVKIFTPTDDYITSFQTFYLHTIDAKMPVIWKSGNALEKFASKFSLNTNFNINYKTTSDDYVDRLNPFGVKTDSEQLIAVKDNKRYTVFFNRNGVGFASDLTYQTTQNKQLLTQGFENRAKEEWLSNIKIDLNAAYTLRLTSSLGKTSNQSDFLSSRNFEITSNAYRPQLIWQPSHVWRLIGSYERKNKRNHFDESSNEFALAQKYMMELAWNQAGKGSLRSTFSIIKIDFSGEAASYLGYLLLDALQPGTNQTWQVNWQQKISRGMQVSLQYNGRKSEQNAPIHTGSVQVTAFF